MKKRNITFILIFVVLLVATGALYGCSPTQYTISFNTNGGQPLPDITFYLKNISIDFEGIIPLRENYAFCGWFFDPECKREAKKIGRSDMVEDITLYAKWQERCYLLPDGTYLFRAGGDLRGASFAVPSQFCGRPVSMVGANAFSGADLRKITIPSSIKRIDRRAFYSCYKLCEVEFQQGTELDYLGEDAFFECSALKSIALPPIKKVEPNAFRSCDALASLFISCGTEVVGDAFSSCLALREVECNSSRVDINANFSNSPWFQGKAAGVVYAGNIAIGYAGSVPADGKIEVAPGTTEIADGCFAQKKGLSQVLLPEGLTRIGKAAFLETGLSQMNLPDSLLEIDNNAFDGCNFAQNISRVPPKLVHAGAGVFKNCTQIVSLPSTLLTVGKAAFLNATGIVNLPDSLVNISGDAFVGTAWFNTFPTGVVYYKDIALGYNGYQKGTFLDTILLKDGTTKIAQNAFNAVSIKKLTVPGSVHSIGSGAFSGCGISTLILQDGIVSIGDNAFLANQIWQVVLPNSVTSLGAGAFSSCARLSAAKLSNQLFYLGEGAFFNTAVSSIYLPKSLQFADTFLTPSVFANSFTIKMEAQEVPPSFHACFLDKKFSVVFGVKE